MDFKEFKDKINALLSSKGLNIEAKFHNDTEKGQFVAVCDGVKIIGRPSGNRLTVKWGSGHTAMATI